MNQLTEEQRKREKPQMDWQQVVLNGGPPCFAQLDDEAGWYCGRAERWDGHDGEHEFVSLNDLLTTARKEAREEAFKEAPPFAAASPAAPQEDDGWVTFGRVKVDIENETETFERISPPVATPTPSQPVRDAAREIAREWFVKTRANVPAAEAQALAELINHYYADIRAEVVKIVEETRASSLWNHNGYDTALSNTLNRLRSLVAVAPAAAETVGERAEQRYREGVAELSAKDAEIERLRGAMNGNMRSRCKNCQHYRAFPCIENCGCNCEYEAEERFPLNDKSNDVSGQQPQA